MNVILNGLIIFGAKYLLVVIAIIALWFFWKLSQIEKKKIISLAIIIFPAAYILAKISAHFYFDARPFVEGHFVPLLPHMPDNGFPSDHTLLSGAIAGVIFFFNRKIGLILLFLAVLVGVARVLAGIHHPIDIIGSLIIAIVVSFLAHRYLLPIVWRSKYFKGYF